jgi:hypothetical protein
MEFHIRHRQSIEHAFDEPLPAKPVEEDPVKPRPLRSFERHIPFLAPPGRTRIPPLARVAPRAGCGNDAKRLRPEQNRPGRAIVTSTDVFNAGRNNRMTRVEAGRGCGTGFAGSVENGRSVKLSGLCESRTAGEPTQAVPFSSTLPTTPRIRASVISSCSASGETEVKSPLWADRGFAGTASTVSFLTGAENELALRSRHARRNKTLASAIGRGSFQVRS